jgi:hypothetical protein
MTLLEPWLVLLAGLVSLTAGAFLEGGLGWGLVGLGALLALAGGGWLGLTLRRLCAAHDAWNAKR